MCTKPNKGTLIMCALVWYAFNGMIICKQQQSEYNNRTITCNLNKNLTWTITVLNYITVTVLELNNISENYMSDWALLILANVIKIELSL